MLHGFLSKEKGRDREIKLQRPEAHIRSIPHRRQSASFDSLIFNMIFGAIACCLRTKRMGKKRFYPMGEAPISARRVPFFFLNSTTNTLAASRVIDRSVNHGTGLDATIM